MCKKLSSFYSSSFWVLKGKCDEFCDKYQEFNSVVIFIDVLLLKSQAYRHLLFNKFQKPLQFRQMLMKISLILLAIDVFVKWFKKDQMSGTEMLVFKFIYFLILSSLGNYNFLFLTDFFW